MGNRSPASSHSDGAGFTVGLTGGIGSGKTLVSTALQSLGAASVDTDVIAHALTAPGGAAMGPIAAQFGADFVTPDGALDRDRMRAFAFRTPAAKKRLEAILHPLIRTAAEEQGREAARLQRPQRQRGEQARRQHGQQQEGGDVGDEQVAGDGRHGLLLTGLAPRRAKIARACGRSGPPAAALAASHPRPASALPYIAL